MPTPMPQTAEQAHAVARQHYRAMLTHAAAGDVYLTADAAGKFQNAAQLAVMYEARQTRLFLAEILDHLTGKATVGEDSHELHAAPPKGDFDGWPVNGRRAG